MTDQQAEWEKYNVQRPRGDISARPAFDAGWAAAIEASAKIAEAISEKHYDKAGELHRKPGEARAEAASDAATEVAEAIRVAKGASASK